MKLGKLFFIVLVIIAIFSLALIFLYNSESKSSGESMVLNSSTLYSVPVSDFEADSNSSYRYKATIFRVDFFEGVQKVSVYIPDLNIYQETVPNPDDDGVKFLIKTDSLVSGNYLVQITYYTSCSKITRHQYVRIG